MLCRRSVGWFPWRPCGVVGRSLLLLSLLNPANDCAAGAETDAAKFKPCWVGVGTLSIPVAYEQGDAEGFYDDAFAGGAITIDPHTRIDYLATNYSYQGPLIEWSDEYLDFQTGEIGGATYCSGIKETETGSRLEVSFPDASDGFLSFTVELQKGTRRNQVMELLRSFVRADDPEGIPRLVQLLDKPYVRSAVIAALAKHKSKSKDAIPKLVRIATDRKPPETETELLDDPYKMDGVREAVIALGEIGMPTEDTLAVLREVVQKEEDELRAEAARSLWKLGEKTQWLIPLLLEDAEHDSTSIEALGDVARGSLEARDALTRILKKRHGTVFADSAAVSLWKLDQGASTPVVLPILLKRLSNCHSVGNLAEMGPFAQPAISPLVARFPFECDDQLRVEMITAIGKIGDPQGLASAALADCLTDDNRFVRLEAARSLWKTTGKPEPALSVIISRLKGEFFRESLQCLDLLHEMGPAAAPAEPAIREMLTSKYVSVRCAARAALDRVAPSKGGQ